MPVDLRAVEKRNSPWSTEITETAIQIPPCPPCLRGEQFLEKLEATGVELLCSNLDSFCRTRQSRAHPRVEPSSDIYHIVVLGTLEQTHRDQAAITALAMHRDRRIFADLRQRRLKPVQRIPIRSSDVSRLELAFATNVQHANGSLRNLRRQLLGSNLPHLTKRQSRTAPAFNAILQIPRDIFNPDPRQARPCFADLIGIRRNQHRT